MPVMMLNLTALIAILSLLIPAALWLAQFARSQQEHRVMVLYRLTALEKRRAQLDSALDMFEQLGAGADILDALQKALIHDLRRMQTLDPGRTGLTAAIEVAGKPRRRKPGEREQAAVNSEQELAALRQRVQGALQLIIPLQQHGGLPRETVTRARRGLEVLVARVGVNSFVLMARHAIDQGNTMKAFSFYRKAERLAQYTSLPEAQKQESLDMIEAEQQQLLQRHENDRGLMLLAGAE
jgi:hypothetical protein